MDAHVRERARLGRLIGRAAVPGPGVTEATPPAAGARRRFDRLDALRAVAMVWMALFHFSFDLDHFGFIHQDFYADPFWTLQRTCIVSLFLFCAGARPGDRAASRASRWPRFWRRWAQVAACALLVQPGLVVDVPAQLHQLRRAARHRGDADRDAPERRCGPLAVAARRWWRCCCRTFVQHPLFDTRWTNWIGLVTRKPVTEDYVPLLPWLGVMWWGLAAGQWVLAHRRRLGRRRAARVRWRRWPRSAAGA